MQVSGSTALVTGANRGIGRALVAALLEAGAAKVYATARHPGDVVVPPGAEGRVVALPLDITSAASIAAAAAQATDVTLLVNNAGVLDFGGALEISGDKLERNFAGNFFGPLNMARAFAPVLEANGGGAIVNTLTIVALASMPGLAGYNASKAAAWSMTQSLRAALAPKGIAVHAVFPGPVDTDMAAEITFPKTSAADVAKAIVDGVQEDHEDIFPDPMSAQVYEGWRQDHKAVERQFAAV